MPKLSFLSARAFDPALAALAGLSAGFVAFAMPEALFSSLVAATPLPALVPAAQPPLGETARLAASGAALMLAFGVTWLVMAALGRAPAKSESTAGSVEAPRLRRADAHPDAPARRPLLARDLGEPLDLEDFPQAPAAEEPAVTAQARPLPAFLIPQAPDVEPVDQNEPEPSEGETPWSELESPWTSPAEAEPAPQAEPRPISELAARLPEGEGEPDQPLAQLVNRIEFGLSRKRQALPAAGEGPPVGQASAEPDNVGHRLRSAISDLQKIASSGG